MILVAPGHSPAEFGAPTIKTERLVMRAIALDDFEACYAMWRDSEIVRFIDGEPRSHGDIWTKLQLMAGHWALTGFGYWALIERDSGRYLGELGFQDAQRGIDPALSGLPEAGWALARGAQGRGYAKEALAAGLDWLEGRFGPVAVWAMIEPNNGKSIRLAEGAGFAAWKTVLNKNGEKERVLMRPPNPTKRG